MKNGISILLFTLMSTYSFAQSGIIRGKVIDHETGEELLGATVVIAGTTNGSITDFEGNYAIRNLTTGTFDISISYVSYQAQTITGIAVIEGEVSQLDIRLSTNVEELDEIVITAELIRNSESALLTVKKKSANLLDGISSQSFAKMGDGNAASAIKRVAGVSVQGGKYVYVRGLGDRYTKSVLNGMDIPGLDPDRNTLQMDIFPTSMIDNMVIVKSFTADLGADFTGGMVNIETKDFPEEKMFKVSAKLGYNPEMHFNNDYLSYNGGSKDWLGFDDGTRDLPIDKSTLIPAADINPYLSVLTKKFNSSLAAQRNTSKMNASLSTSFGNQINRDKATWGYNAAVSYRNNTKFYKDRENNIYQKPKMSDEVGLEADRLQKGDVGINSVLMSGLLGGAFKTDKSKIRLKLMHIQNGESKAGFFERKSLIRSSNTSFRDNLEYSERSISNLLIGGKHILMNDDGLELEWKFSPTYSKIEDKDIRVTPYRFDDGVYSIEPSETGSPTRLWRNLDEINYVSKVDLTKLFEISNRASKLKFGISYTNKQRNYEILNYKLNVVGQTTLGLTGQADELLTGNNIWTVQKRKGVAIAGNFEPSNSYEASQNNLGFYVSNEFQFTEKLKSIIGIRAEKYEQFYTGQNQRATQVFNNEKVIDDLDFFPSINIIFASTDVTNIRFSYSKTIARPSFKEASTAQIYDPLIGNTFIGGLTIVDGINDTPIKSSRINNFDLRWEMFQQKGQMISISGFYKAFSDPIELVTFSESAPDNFQPRNLGDAKVYGVELETRKNLSFLSPQLSKFTINANMSLIKSRLEMDKNLGGEYESRKNNLRDGEPLNSYRQMQGQAPYLINFGVSYTQDEKGLDAGIFYNVQGKRLAIVGVGSSPDVYDQPFQSVNFKISKSLGKTRNAKISFAIQNLLDDKIESMYESFGSGKKIFSSYKPGRTFSVKYAYSF